MSILSELAHLAVSTNFLPSWSRIRTNWEKTAGRIRDLRAQNETLCLYATLVRQKCRAEVALIRPRSCGYGVKFQDGIVFFSRWRFAIWMLRSSFSGWQHILYCDFISGWLRWRSLWRSLVTVLEPDCELCVIFFPWNILSHPFRETPSVAQVIQVMEPGPSPKPVTVNHLLSPVSKSPHGVKVYQWFCSFA